MENQAITEPAAAPKSDSNLLTLVLTACLTAVVIGLGVYWAAAAHYEKIQDQKIETATQEMQRQIENLEGQISRLKADEASAGAAVDSQESSTAADSQTGYIDSVYQRNGKRYLKVDYVQFLTGEEAVQAAVEDTGCVRDQVYSGDCSPSLNNDYYIRNQNDKIRTLEIAKDAVIENLSSDGVTPTTIDFQQFEQIFAGGDESSQWLREAPYNIEIKNGLVVNISQQYIP